MHTYTHSVLACLRLLGVESTTEGTLAARSSYKKELGNYFSRTFGSFLTLRDYNARDSIRINVRKI